MHTDLTIGSINTHLVKLSLPAMTGYFFHTMFNVTDTVFAGYISTESLSALALSASIFFMILAVGIGMSEALTSLVGNALGAKQKDKAQHIALNGVVFSFILSIFLTLIGIISVPFLISILGDPSYVVATLSYINIILYASVFFMASFFFNALLNATGDTKSFRNILIFTSLLNIVLNYLFVFHYEFGIRGIAMATVISEFITMTYLFYKLKKTQLWRGFKGFEFDMGVIKELGKQGFAPSMNMFMMAFGMYIITYFVAPYGKEAVGAFGIGMRVEQVFLMPVVGLGIATLAIVSQNNGAKEFKRIQPTVNLAILSGFGVSLLGVISFFTIGEFIVSFLTNDVLVIKEAVLYLKICGFGFFGFVLIFIYVSTLQGIKKPAIIFPISVYRQVVAPIIIFSLLAYYNLEIQYLWFTLVGIVFSAAIYLWWYTSKKIKRLSKKTK